LWGALLAFSLLLGVAGFVNWRAEVASTPSSSEGLELAEPEAADETPLPDGFVPDLPPVPTLPADFRPPSRSADTSEDARLTQLSAEMRLLQQARTMLTEDTAGALALLDQHREHYPQGALSEEREAYALEALVRLRQMDRAERRYLDFRGNYPESTFIPRLERLMQ
jgi:hypothetical protein